jgi:hypothetical protein
MLSNRNEQASIPNRVKQNDADEVAESSRHWPAGWGAPNICTIVVTIQSTISSACLAIGGVRLRPHFMAVSSKSLGWNVPSRVQASHEYDDVSQVLAATPTSVSWNRRTMQITSTSCRWRHSKLQSNHLYLPFPLLVSKLKGTKRLCG